jgi:hypothetical protein
VVPESRGTTTVVLFSGGGGLLLLIQPASMHAARMKLDTTFIIYSCGGRLAFAQSLFVGLLVGRLIVRGAASGRQGDKRA